MEFDTKESDSWETPLETFQDLAEFVDIPSGAVVWDPFYSTGRSKGFLKKAFPQARIVHKKRDFFTTKQDADVIITNPPFSIMKRILPDLLERGIPFAVLLLGQQLFQKYGQDILQRGGAHVTVLWPETRLNYIDPKTGEKAKRNSMFSVWLLYKIPLSAKARRIEPTKSILMRAM